MKKNKFEKNTKRILSIGASGSGKSTRAKSLLLKSPRSIVFDPMDEYAGENRLYIRATTIKQVKEALYKNWNKGFHISFVPDTNKDMAKQLLDLWVLLKHVQTPYFSYKDNRVIKLLIEEMDQSFPNRALSDELMGLNDLALRGRHYGVETLGITQRPALVSKAFTGQCQEIYIFPLAEEIDYKSVLQKIGKKFEDKLRSLEPHSYIKWSSGGDVTDGRNVFK